MSPLITIVIPTRNRPDFLRSLIRYFASHECKSCQFIIADSSRELATRRKNRKMAEKGFRTLSGTYLEFPEDSRIQEKFLTCIQKAAGQFLAMCADDDFLVMPTVIKCAKFLLEHRDYSTAHGRAFTIFLDPDDRPSGKLMDIKPYPQQAYEDASLSQRLIRHMGNYSTTWYSVHRTELIERNLRSTFDYLDDFNFMELATSCQDAIQGKIKALDDLYLVRRSNAPDKIFIPPWYKMGKWQETYDIVVSALAHEIISVESISKSEAETICHEALGAYLAPFEETYLKNLGNPPDQNGQSFLNAGTPLIPQILHRAHKALFRIFKQPDPTASARIEDALSLFPDELGAIFRQTGR